MIVPTQYLLLELNTVYIAEGINDLTVRKALLNQYGIEIGGGLGEFKGKVRRMGLMGYSSRKENVILLIAWLESILKKFGHITDKSANS